MQFLNALEQAQRHVKTLWCVIVLLVALNVCLIMAWHESVHRIQVDLPPKIPESGLMIEQGEVPKTTIYSFAYYIWQSLNHWPKDGSEYDKNLINKFSPFITPNFQDKLISEYNQLLNAGELQDRLRSLQGLSGEAYSPSDVTYVGHGTWLVKLTMRLTERMSSDNTPVKDADIQYTLRVVKYDVDVNSNPWGLALDGFGSVPVRVRTII